MRRGIDMIVNGSYWFGAAAGAAGSLLLLSGSLVSLDLGWRIGFGVGGVLGLGVIFLRRFVPESPRWLITHGREESANKTAERIEHQVERDKESTPGRETQKKITVHPQDHFGLRPILTAMFGKLRRRSFLALTLMTAQAFLFNAVFFTYGLVLARFYNVANNRVGLYLLPLAVSNFLGPIALAVLFDTIGRKRMITGSFAVTGFLLIAVVHSLGSTYLGPGPRHSRGCWSSLWPRQPQALPI
jgi:hypothetical protein